MKTILNLFIILLICLILMFTLFHFSMEKDIKDYTYIKYDKIDSIKYLNKNYVIFMGNITITTPKKYITIKSTTDKLYLYRLHIKVKYPEHYRYVFEKDVEWIGVDNNIRINLFKVLETYQIRN